jgi:hypothetical protein
VKTCRQFFFSKAVSRKKNIMNTKYNEWLRDFITFDVNFPERSERKHVGGRPGKPFEKKSYRNKRRSVKKIQETFGTSTELFLLAAEDSAKKNRRKNVGKNLKKIRKRIGINDGDDDFKTVLSTEQGLMLLLNAKLTQKQYEFTQKFFKRNKEYNNDRNQFARKISRLGNIRDVFNRSMDTSDPLILSLSQEKQKKNNTELPEKVKIS